MHWNLVAFVTIIPFLAIQAAHAESGQSNPMCDFACWMSPEDAPASCGCKASKGGRLKQPPTTPAQKPSAAPALVPPTGSNCQVICLKNPATAPPSCNCALSQGGGTGSAGGGMGPAVTPKSIAADGVVSVAELLDYMEQLYRSRIAGVQRIQFMERKVAGKSGPLSRREREPRVIPVANTQPAQDKPTAKDEPTVGVDTMIWHMYFLEKMWRGEGHEAFKVLSPPEVAARQDLTPPPGSRNHRDLEVAKKVQKDPAMLLEALGLKPMAKDMRDQVEKEKNDEDLFAEDVLEELLALKKVLDQQATAEGLAVASGRMIEPMPPTLQLGWVRWGTLKFEEAKRPCESNLGCTTEEIFKALPIGQEDYTTGWNPEQHYVCLVWTHPNSNKNLALAKFALRQGISMQGDMGAQLWLPIPHKVLLDIFREANKDRLVSSQVREDVDRPIRALVEFYHAQEAKYYLYDRVYGDFRKVSTGDGPEMNVPHRIREQLKIAPCEKSIDAEKVWTQLFYPDDPEDTTERVKKGKGDRDDRCITALRTAKTLVTDRIRAKFEINRPIMSSAEQVKEMQMKMYEEYGCMGQRSDDPNSPC